MIKESILKIVQRQNLTDYESEGVLLEIMEGKATDAQISAFLTALRMKGETIEEIASFAKIMRQKSVRIYPKVECLVDTCGTGGDSSKTFNISTVSAIVVSGAGIPVAKHGNRAVSSACGSADVLKELRVNIELTPPKVEECIEKFGFGFMYAPNFHPSMKFVANARRETGIRTVFNLLGPLTNPANARSQLIGVFDENLLLTVVHVLKNLGSNHVIAVHGNGLDEITNCGKTRVCELKDGNIETYCLEPRDIGIELSKPDQIIGGTAKENSKIILDVLYGEKGPKRDIVLLNAAGAIMTADKVKNFKDAIELAAYSIDSKKALNKLKELVKFTNA
jgi:anthranilate phosphoribosyltransferase